MALKLLSKELEYHPTVKVLPRIIITDCPKLLHASMFSLPIPPSYISASAAFRRELTNSFSKAIASLFCTVKDELTL